VEFTKGNAATLAMVPDFKAAVMSLMKFSPSSGPAYFYGYLSSKMTSVNTEESKMSP